MSASPSNPGARGARRPYHHGDLRRALLDAGQHLLSERGVEGFSLREVARRAGVSAAAPAHHFGDLTGLMTAMATEAFERLARHLRQATEEGGEDPRRRYRSQGRGYVEFALANPGLFRTMFRKELVDNADPALQAARQEAFAQLLAVVAAAAGVGPASLDRSLMAVAIGAWSMVHGHAMLRLDGVLPTPFPTPLGEVGIPEVLVGVPDPVAPVSIRRGQPEDHAALSALKQRAALAVAPDPLALALHPEALSVPAEWLADGCVLVAEAGGAIAGFAAVEAGELGAADLSALFVEPRHWRHGIGGRLVEQAAAHAGDAGADVLFVVAGPETARFYASRGFETVGPQATLLGPAVRLRRPLGPGGAS
ncbi:hypothetical protein STAQ_36500 [Allostella sp. ATCC 35155]|nr:hypothetical protein STAQ_36500 [Stella sp. ATCC 35155]